MPHSGGAFFSKRSTGIFFRANGCGKNIFAGKLKYGLAILPEYKVKAHVLKLFYAVRSKFSFCPHFLSGNFILRNMCQLLRFYLQALLYFWRVRQKSPLSLSKKFSSPASEKCNPNQVSTPFTLILRLFCLVCGQQAMYNVMHRVAF